MRENEKVWKVELVDYSKCMIYFVEYIGQQSEKLAIVKAMEYKKKFGFKFSKSLKHRCRQLNMFESMIN